MCFWNIGALVEYIFLCFYMYWSKLVTKTLMAKVRAYGTRQHLQRFRISRNNGILDNARRYLYLNIYFFMYFADLWSPWRWRAKFSLLLLPLNTRSGYNRLEGFSASKRRLILRGGRETTSEGGKRWNARGCEKRGEYYCYRLK